MKEDKLKEIIRTAILISIGYLLGCLIGEIYQKIN